MPGQAEAPAARRLLQGGVSLRGPCLWEGRVFTGGRCRAGIALRTGVLHPYVT